MNFIPGEFYHVYNRGNDRRTIFFKDANYHFFLQKIRTQLLPGSDLISYCLMPNHFHLLLRPLAAGLVERISFGGKPMQELAYRIGILLSSYSQAINNQNKSTGSLFQQKTKAKILSETNHGSRISYFENCFHYIHQNPGVARLVRNLNDWPFSSYPDYTGLREGSLCNMQLFYSLTGIGPEEIRKRTLERIDKKILEKIF